MFKIWNEYVNFFFFLRSKEWGENGCRYIAYVCCQEGLNILSAWLKCSVIIIPQWAIPVHRWERFAWVIQCLLKPASACVHFWSEGIWPAPSASVGKTGPYISSPKGFLSMSKKPKVSKESVTKCHNYSSVAEPRQTTDVTSFYDSRKGEEFTHNSRKWDDKWIRCGCSRTYSCTER